MKIIHVLAVLFLTIGCLNAQKYFTKEGKISFYSEAPVENIEAHNYKVTSVFDAESGAMEWAVLIKAFQFEKALMQEHFNENYMESSTFPKAMFKGKVENISDVDFTSDGQYPVKVTGDLMIHGVTNPIETEAKFIVKNGTISGTSEFSVLVGVSSSVEILVVVPESTAALDDSFAFAPLLSIGDRRALLALEFDTSVALHPPLAKL